MTTRIVLTLCSLTLLAVASRAELAPTQPLPEDAPTDQILDALDARGKDLKDFSADVKLTETDPALALSSTRAGKVWFQSKPDGDARMRVRFDTREEAAGQPKRDRIDYSYDKGWLIDRNYRARNQVRRQVVQPGQKINLLKLGEGPFPLPIGQPKQSVHDQFDVAKVAPKKDDPADTLHLQLKPKKGTRLARRFETIDVWVDRKTHMPTRIETAEQGGKNLRTTDLTNIQVNTNLPEAEFKLQDIDAGWSLHDEAFQE